MSNFEQKPETGALFKNLKKEKETHPDYKGDATIEGKRYWVNAWVNASKKGTKYFSLRFSEKEVVQQEGYQKAVDSAQSVPQSEVFDDDIPF